MGEPHPGRQLAHHGLVVPVHVGVHQHHGKRLDALLTQPPQVCLQPVPVQRLLHQHALARCACGGRPAALVEAALCALENESLLDLNDLLVEHLGADNLQVEESRPGLIPNEENILEALGDGQGHALTLAF